MEVNNNLKMVLLILQRLKIMKRPIIVLLGTIDNSKAKAIIKAKIIC